MIGETRIHIAIYSLWLKQQDPDYALGLLRLALPLHRVNRYRFDHEKQEFYITVEPELTPSQLTWIRLKFPELFHNA